MDNDLSDNNFGESPFVNDNESVVQGGNFMYQWKLGAQMFVLIDALMIVVLLMLVYMLGSGKSFTDLNGVLQGVALVVVPMYLVSEWMGREKATELLNSMVPQVNNSLRSIM